MVRSYVNSTSMEATNQLPAVSQLANTAPRAASIDRSATMSEHLCFVRSLVGFARQMSDDQPL